MTARRMARPDVRRKPRARVDRQGPNPLYSLRRGCRSIYRFSEAIPCLKLGIQAFCPDDGRFLRSAPLLRRRNPGDGGRSPPGAIVVTSIRGSGRRSRRRRDAAPPPGRHAAKAVDRRASFEAPVPPGIGTVFGRNILKRRKSGAGGSSLRFEPVGASRPCRSRRSPRPMAGLRAASGVAVQATWACGFWIVPGLSIGEFSDDGNPSKLRDSMFPDARRRKGGDKVLKTLRRRQLCARSGAALARSGCSVRHPVPRHGALAHGC